MAINFINRKGSNNDISNFFFYEYIKVNGDVMYIDTGYYANQNTELIIKYANFKTVYDNQKGTLFGSKYLYRNNSSSSYSQSDRFSFSTYSNGNFNFGDKEATSNKTLWGNNKTFQLKFNKNGIYEYNENNSSYTQIGNLPSANDFTTKTTLALFCLNQYMEDLYGDYSSTEKLMQGMWVDLYFVEIYENENLLYKFIPAKNKSTRELGLYDIVNRKFHVFRTTDTIELGNRISI